MAWLAAIEICQVKRLTVNATTDEAFEMITAVITDSLDAHHVVEWFGQRLEWIK